MHSLMKLVLPIAAAALLPVDDAAARVYKWVDEEGNVHYSQTLPPGQQAESIRDPPKVDTEDAIEELKQDQDAFAKRQAEEQKRHAEEQKLAAEAKETAERCATLRSNLDGLLNTQRIYEGEGDARRRIGEEERQARIKSTEEAIAKDCK